MRGSRKLFISTAMALMGALALAGIADGHKTAYKSSISLSIAPGNGTQTASGQVSSARAACRGGRSVALYEDKTPTADGGTTQIGTVTTTSTGAWTASVQGGAKSGRVYFAQITFKRLVKNKKHRHVCKGGTSNYLAG
jgi:hypothetical protein